MDACNEHVGQGGGQPHFHGDSFGCQYTAADYTTLEMHPPVIGWSYDGYDIRGRHLSVDAPGYDAPLLDDCGGKSSLGDAESLLGDAKSSLGDAQATCTMWTRTVWDITTIRRCDAVQR